MQVAQNDANIIDEARDAARGYVAVQACAAGWPALLSVHMGRLADTAMSARLICGVEASEAIRLSVVDVELMAAAEIFGAELAKGKSPQAAFETMLAVKRETLSEVEGIEPAFEAATNGFNSALDYGMSPFAALIAANITAASAAMLIMKNNEQMN